jgi:pimeloyl-ACP methyl ester carboxylesterase
MLRWFAAGLLILTVLMILLVAAAPTAPPPQAMRQEAVVLLHGIAQSSLLMKPLQRRLEHAGYKVINLDYPSTQMRIEEAVNYIVAPRVRDYLGAFDGTVHFVTFSMGSLLARELLKQYPPKNLGRVVMIGPPNQGSEVADALQDWELYRTLYGPAGEELTTAAIKIEEVDYELGVIAGDVAIDPIGAHLIPGPDDGRVAVARTQLPGMKAMTIVHAPHTMLQLMPSVWERVIRFLETGAFDAQAVKPSTETIP